MATEPKIIMMVGEIDPNWERNLIPHTIIITKRQYDRDYASRSGSSLIFEADLWDCVRYVNTTKLRSRFNLKGRGKVLHILVGRTTDKGFINKQNKDVVYKTPVCCSADDDGATRAGWGGYQTNHPLGDVIVVLADRV
jgi:hypothetical protein